MKITKFIALISMLPTLAFASEPEFTIGKCVTDDVPPWITDSPVLKIIGEWQSSYHVTAVKNVSIIGTNFTIRRYALNVFQITFQENENIEHKKLLIPLRVTNCPVDTKVKE
jgi:hypothetical protein